MVNRVIRGSGDFLKNVTLQTFSKCLLLSSLALIPAAGAPYSFDFATPVQTAAAQAPGKWYPDRFPPCGFVSPATAPDGSGGALKESICAADHQDYATRAFYNTQGRKFDLPAATVSMTIALYVPRAWATENGRKAGFWATAFDAGGAVADFPIIDFQGAITTDAQGPGYYPNGGVAGFYGWNNVTATYDFIGLPTGFTYDSWVQLTITLVPGTGIRYTAGDKTLISPFGGADVSLGNVILQGYNYAQNYDIFWNGVIPSYSFLSRYASNLTAGDSIVNITNTGANGNSLFGPGVGNSTGNICANVYAFSPDEQLISCCSCLVTPNGLVHMTAINDLISNTLTGVSPNSIVVKVIATSTAVSGNTLPYTGSSCTNSAALVGTAPFPLANGVLAWGTTLHSASNNDPPAGPFSITETPFLRSTLHPGDLASLANRCVNIMGNGSTFGQCRSCRLGGLGGAKQ